MAAAASWSSTNVLGTGWVVLVTMNRISRLAIGGRIKTFLRGKISSIIVPSSDRVTLSPATGVMPRLRKMPRALQSTMPSGVFT